MYFVVELLLGTDRSRWAYIKYHIQGLAHLNFVNDTLLDYFSHSMVPFSDCPRVDNGAREALCYDILLRYLFTPLISRVTLYTAGHLHTAVPHCSHSRAPIVHTAVLRENNEHGCVYLRCTAVCKLPGCVEGHPCICIEFWFSKPIFENGLYNTDLHPFLE